MPGYRSQRWKNTFKIAKKLIFKLCSLTRIQMKSKDKRNSKFRTEPSVLHRFGSPYYGSAKIRSLKDIDTEIGPQIWQYNLKLCKRKCISQIVWQKPNRKTGNLQEITNIYKVASCHTISVKSENTCYIDEEILDFMKPSSHLKTWWEIIENLSPNFPFLASRKLRLNRIKNCNW